MKLKIVNKEKFKVRITEVVIFITTIIITIVSINEANSWRGYSAVGGEYLIPFFGGMLMAVLEGRYEIHEEQQKKIKQKMERKEMR